MGRCTLGFGNSSATSEGSPTYLYKNNHYAFAGATDNARRIVACIRRRSHQAAEATSEIFMRLMTSVKLNSSILSVRPAIPAQDVRLEGNVKTSMHCSKPKRQRKYFERLFTVTRSTL